MTVRLGHVNPHILRVEREHAMARTVIETVRVRLTCIEDGTLRSAAIEYRGTELANTDDVGDDSGVAAEYIGRSLLDLLPGSTGSPR